MTDLEMIKKCAEKMGIDYQDQGDIITVNNCRAFIYDPLHDDAQAMALVKRFNIFVMTDYEDDPEWSATIHMKGTDYEECDAWSKDLNRAIVECVCKLN